MRANKHDKTVFEKICKAREKHCKVCNNCHGNGSLFLRKKDVTSWEQKANAGVIVPDNKIPEPVKEKNPK